MRYRIKQLSKNEFVPQVKENIFTKWGSIKYYKSTVEPFYIYYYNEQYCSRSTYEAAEIVIELHKEWCKEREGYPIYHKK